MDINDKIKKAIEEDLPTQVGEVLKKKLEEGVANEVKIITLEKEKKTLNETVSDLKSKNSKLESNKAFEFQLDERDKKIVEKEQELKLREAVLDAKEEVSSTHRQNYLDVVKAVFGNNKFKYSENGTIPVTRKSSQDYEVIDSQSISKNVEGEK